MRIAKWDFNNVLCKHETLFFVCSEGRLTALTAAVHMYTLGLVLIVTRNQLIFFFQLSFADSVSILVDCNSITAVVIAADVVSFMYNIHFSRS